MNDMKILRTALIAVAALMAAATPGFAAEFFLRADVTSKTMPDGQVIRMWGFALDTAFDANDGAVTVPGPVLTVPPGDTMLTIHLKNNLTAARTGLSLGCPVSLVIPGQVTMMTPVRFGDTPYPEFKGRVRSLTHETDPGNTTAVDYMWNNFKPGTYVYHSGTHVQCHVQMGLYGGVIKDYASSPEKQAYPGVLYETSVPIFFSEIDPAFHAAVDSNNYGPGKLMTSTIDYEPKYFLINGQPFTSAQPLLPAGSHGGGTLLRFFNMGLETRCPLLQGSFMTLIAEDGQPYTYPKEQYVASLPAGKTIDAMVAFPAAGTYPLYDRRLGLTNNKATGGGMLKRLDVTTGSFWPVISSVTATPSAITDTQTSQLQVTATDADTDPASLVYTWQVPPGAGTLDNTSIANPIFTPAFAGTTQMHTFTITVSDGAGSPRVDTATVDVTVTPTPPVTLVSLEISGPATVAENATAQYTALAHFSDGSSSPVQPQMWMVDVAQASIDAAGLLTAAAVDADTPAVVSAEYTASGVTVADTHSITIVNTDGPVPVEVIVDNRDAGNSFVGTWAVSGGANPWATDSVWSRDAGGSFTFNGALVPGTTYRVYAWWTAWSTRHTAVPYQIRTGATLLGTVNVNQRLNGGRWNLLGTYTFNGVAGVTVLATPGTTVTTCADAVRFVPVVVGPVPAEVIVDNLDAGTSSVGTWAVSGGPNPWVADSVWSRDVGGSFAFSATLVPGTYQVYAWWTTWSTRYTAVPHQIRNGATLLGTVNVNQRNNGGQWNLLGTYTFDSTASVTILATPGTTVTTCADAVRFVPVP